MMYTNKPVKPTGMKVKPKDAMKAKAKFAKLKATGKTTGSIGPKLKKDTPKAKGGMKKNLPAYPGMSTGKLTKGPNRLGKGKLTKKPAVYGGLRSEGGF
jgi:hypothetical protein